MTGKPMQTVKRQHLVAELVAAARRKKYVTIPVEYGTGERPKIANSAAGALVGKIDQMEQNGFKVSSEKLFVYSMFVDFDRHPPWSAFWATASMALERTMRPSSRTPSSSAVETLAFALT